MPLWNNIDSPAGNTKPQAWSNDSVTSANTVYGVSVTELANTQSIAAKAVPHAGWVRVYVGTGPLGAINITNPGSGINANGFLSITGGGGDGTANASYIVSSNANSQLNVITQIVLNNPGAKFNSAPTISFTGANTVAPTFAPVLGGRAGRVRAETLVAMATISSDNTLDDTLFPGT